MLRSSLVSPSDGISGRGQRRAPSTSMGGVIGCLAIDELFHRHDVGIGAAVVSDAPLGRVVAADGDGRWGLYGRANVRPAPQERQRDHLLVEGDVPTVRPEDPGAGERLTLELRAADVDEMIAH